MVSALSVLTGRSTFFQTDPENRPMPGLPSTHYRPDSNCYSKLPRVAAGYLDSQGVQGPDSVPLKKYLDVTADFASFRPEGNLNQRLHTCARQVGNGGYEGFWAHSAESVTLNDVRDAVLEAGWSARRQRVHLERRETRQNMVLRAVGLGLGFGAGLALGTPLLGAGVGLLAGLAVGRSLLPDHRQAIEEHHLVEIEAREAAYYYSKSIEVLKGSPDSLADSPPRDATEPETLDETQQNSPTSESHLEGWLQTRPRERTPWVSNSTPDRWQAPTPPHWPRSERERRIMLFQIYKDQQNWMSRYG